MTREKLLELADHYTTFDPVDMFFLDKKFNIKRLAVASKESKVWFEFCDDIRTLAKAVKELVDDADRDSR